ncbi:hypothetical protein T06_5079 [Trichinella sp. T6]|nr:hypothetical protein T06_5079 [Trichinella sp. T6]
MEKNAHGEERRQVEKAKIGERLWIGWIESFVGQLRSLVNSVRWSIPFVGQVSANLVVIVTPKEERNLNDNSCLNINFLLIKMLIGVSFN